MSRPDVACVCVDLGIHAALTVVGRNRDRLIAQFHADHSGPGHLPEDPPRDWYGKEAAFKRYLDRLRTPLAHTEDDLETIRTARDQDTIDPKGRL